MESRIAIIPARGGSKRIPGKNSRLFCGEPILRYPIRAALSSGLFDEVMVSTDDEGIADLAQGSGAKVPFLRSEANSSDFATTLSVIKEVVSAYERMGRRFSSFCCLYPTAPFVTARKLQEAEETFSSEAADTLVTVCRYTHPIQRALKIDGGQLSFMEPENANKRTQDLEVRYHDAGQFYFGRIEGLEARKMLFSGKVVPFELNELEVQDIDNEIDWQLGELKFRLTQS